MVDAPNTNLVFLPIRLARNRIEHIIDAADTALPSRSGLTYYLELLTPVFPQSTEFGRLVLMPGSEKPPRSFGNTTSYEGAFFQIDALLDGMLERQKPASGQRDMSVVVSLTSPYCLVESIQNNRVLLQGTTRMLPKQWVMKAGLSESDFAGWGDRFFDQYQQTNRQFLTWQPDQKIIGPKQEEYLHFLLNTSPMPTTVIRRVEVTYEDGTTDTMDRGTLTGLSLYQVVCAPVGPLALGLDALPKAAKFYRVWLSDANRTRISLVRTYRIDPRYRRNERAVLFNNSLGGFDTLRLVGMGQEKLTTQRSAARLERPLGAARDFSELRVIYVEGTRELTVSTGWIERSAKQTLRYFDELLLAEDLYIIGEDGHRAVDLVTSQLVDADDNENLIARTFTFRFAQPERAFSAMPVAPAQAARPTAWRGVGFRPLLNAMGYRTGLGVAAKLRKYYLDDNTDVRPITEKANVQGDPDFVPPSPMPDAPANTTPFPSAAISRAGALVRSNCANGQVGGPALITIPAGRYGGESAGDADALAEAEFRATDTQAYANANGTCTAINEFYAWNVPNGHWHYRTNRPDLIEIWHKFNGPADMGNARALQDQSGPYIFRPGSNHLDFPVGDSWWYHTVFGPAGRAVRVTVYQNGTQVLTVTHTLNAGGFEIGGLLNKSGNPPITVQSGDRFYVKYELLN